MRQVRRNQQGLKAECSLNVCLEVIIWNIHIKPEGRVQIQCDLVDGKVSNVSFVGGCNGNLQGISLLAEGMEASKVIEILKDIDCNGRGTSCPAQLARALKEAVN